MTLTVAVAAALPLTASVDGETVQVAPVGAPLHDNAMFPLNPLLPPTEME
ncbi:MAG TPA: hypothetical protein VGJ06_02775 [Candidatus Acidoferrum sp.]|jgi:hypothetical protein